MRLALLDDYQHLAASMADWGRLAPRATVDIFHDNIADFEPLVVRLLPYDAIMIVRERTRFSRALFERLPNLKLLITAATWNAAIDLEAATDHHVQVCSTDEIATPTAELTIGMMIALARNIPQEDRAVREGRWVTTLGIGLHGKTLGVIGLGLVGQQVTRLALAFGMTVLAWSPNMTVARAAAHGARFVSKDELLARADVLSLHIKLSDRTRGLIGAPELALMKSSALLVNTGRGPLVDEVALIAHLAAGRIAGAALDVFDIEPLPRDHPFCALNNVILLPHLGFVVDENYQLFYQYTLDAVEAFLDGRVLRPQNAISGVTT